MTERQNKNWLITGTSSGFGRHMTELLLERGDRVAATVRNVAALDELARRYPETLWVRSLDVTDTAQINRVVDDAFATLGGIDVVVSNAGYGLFGAAEELDDEQIERQLNTNLVGSIQLIRAAIRHLRPQGGGRSLELFSMGGQVAFPSLWPFHATKWGIEGFVESLFEELAPFSIKLTLVEPGGARTDFGSRSAELAAPLEAYQQGFIDQMRRSVSSGISHAKGDPRKMAAAMVGAADSENPPRRLALGGDADAAIRAALMKRLAELKAQHDIAHSTEFDA